MRTSQALTNQTTRFIRRLRVWTVVLALGLPAVSSQSASADGAVVPPPVPANLNVPTGHTAYLVGHATGTQDYICMPCPNAITTAATCPTSGFAWAFFGPQATLLNDGDQQIITHFLSPNPQESNKARPTWQHSRDTSTVWGNKIANASNVSDPTFVAPNSIDWFLLQVVGSQSGPTGGALLTPTTYIQRLNTSGGVAPATVCDQSMVGKMSLVPYTANYFFYKATPAAQHRR